jgi:hypothetical protein
MMLLQILAGIGLVSAIYLVIHHSTDAAVWLYDWVTRPAKEREQELTELRKRLDDFSAMLRQAQSPALPPPTIVEHTDAKL